MLLPNTAAEMSTISLNMDGQPSSQADADILCLIAAIDGDALHRKHQRIAQSLLARQLLTQALLSFHGLYYTLATLPLGKTENGKPFLAIPHAPLISISHSKKWVTCAVAKPAKVDCLGIDIETITDKDWQAYSPDIFNQHESNWIMAANGDERNARGLTCWCRKEAIAKAVGTGLSFPPSHIGFDQHQRLISLPDDMGQAQDWHIHDSNLQDEAILCIAWKALPMDNAV